MNASLNTRNKQQVRRTVRLEEGRLRALLDHLDARSAAHRGARDSARYPYRALRCVVHVQQPGDASLRAHIVPSRDLSASGMSFVHGGYIHRGARCVVQLSGRHGNGSDIPGTVVRCDYVAGGLYDVGIRFNARIQPEEFCQAAISHRILLVEDCPSHARCGLHFLQQLNARVDIADDGHDALRMALDRPYDLILMDVELPVLDGLAATRELRRRGYLRRIVATTACDGPGDRERCLRAGCDAYLPKPYSRDCLIELIASLGQEPLLSTLAGDPGCGDVIAAFVSELPAALRELEEIVAANDRMRLQRCARNLRCSSRSLGFEPISQAAGALEALCLSETEPAALRPAMQKLMELSSLARYVPRPKAAPHAACGPPPPA